MRKFLCVALIMGVLAFPAFADDDKYIVVDVDASGPTRLEAINGALLDAIRTAAGQFIDAKTELNNDELNEKIIAYSRGSVAGYEVLSEDGTKADEGVYSVKVRVRVTSGRRESCHEQDSYSVIQAGRPQTRKGRA